MSGTPVSIEIETQKGPSGPSKWALLALGFRPFFLLGICFAVLLMLVSLGGFSSGLWQNNYFNLSLWHAHEMVFAYAVAVIAGFLLTSVRNWTGLDTSSGTSLALLTLLWLAPRLLSAASFIPPVAFALLDMLFLPVLALVLARLLLQAKQSNNYPIPLLLLLLGLCNAAVHAEVLGYARDVSAQAMQLAVVVIVALIVLIAGRVVPFFMQRAIALRPVANKTIEKLALPSVLLFALTIATGQPWLIILAAFFASLIHGARLIGWFNKAILQQPMLWVLHAGYAWLVAGFLIYAISMFIGIPTVQAIHAWTVGAIGMFTLGMMARVALGHTGRNITALPWMPAAFILLLLATLIRILPPLIEPVLLDASVIISATCWIIAFIIVGLRYASILLHARVDGKPG
ncbi:MAG: hypothetical protein COW19_03950 [Zetaproteobacteria bacterium CG12_big_fil_rev_8_21_14_0_65_55_1124]|nr:MAG: hypothetical protein COT53_02095 [Zetaproteobacteria bacterium CG08_land_8_20_14_0_20_55_17]PIW43189.1 MAG: hypothetical protein COW19_03950 [Zetaproteobacteria bacterium CG12_big_fil_rev_8_21_14_0_65_55_1124]PIY53187.1 MAG: hypothetical protein COZ01_04980 [Zetaproteobacteria bacterium CG_4_10_14_0_8_um_filter_55_43]PIZ39699.1 MAG: hypothetical protein COY36_02360 [Zetaproteobacteria bacterium CG_4_10_14_0_2_um_filter_55_20]PJB79402.1 MAG: hypothetical protein CO089_10520 [Zetaproteoba